MKKWVVKFFEQKEINYIVDAETGDKAVEIACYKAKIKYNPKNLPSCAFMRIETEKDLKYFI